MDDKRVFFQFDIAAPLECSLDLIEVVVNQIEQCPVRDVASRDMEQAARFPLQKVAVSKATVLGDQDSVVTISRRRHLVVWSPVATR